MLFVVRSLLFRYLLLEFLCFKLYKKLTLIQFVSGGFNNSLVFLYSPPLYVVTIMESGGLIVLQILNGRIDVRINSLIKTIPFIVRAVERRREDGL